MRAFFSNTVSSAEIKATSTQRHKKCSGFNKKTLYTVRAHSFSGAIVRKSKSKLNKAKSKALRKDIQNCSKGNQNEQE